MATLPSKNVKIKSSNNKAPAIETKRREPNHQAALEYIDTLMQKAPGSRNEHITGQQALLQLGKLVQQLREQPTLLEMEKEVAQRDKTIEKLQKQIDKLKGK